jgi:acetyltransferase-like isoleucine patch superfamily enzyme
MRARYLRVGWTVISIVIVQGLVCGLALVPVVMLWHIVNAQPLTPTARIVVQSIFIVPSYVLFALALLAISPVATWLTRARTPEGATLRIADLDWPLLKWVEYMAATHVVRLFAGPLLRGSPLWTAYLRFNGARLGHGVYVNSLSISDHNLLEFGDHVVIGADVHVSGHTVEGGLVKTGRVKLGRDVTVGLGSVIEIGVDIGDEAQIGALSFVPKHTRLAGGAVYAGVPARPLAPPVASTRHGSSARNVIRS